MCVCLCMRERELDCECSCATILFFKGFVSLVPVVYFPMLIYVPLRLLTEVYNRAQWYWWAE